MKYVNWNIASLNSMLTGNSTRAKQTRTVLGKIIKLDPDVLGFQEIRVPATGPKDTSLKALKKLFPKYSIVWRAAKLPAKTSYSGTMFLYKQGLNVEKILRPSIASQKLDGEGRLLGLEFENYFLLNSYIPHYEYHNPKQHAYWLSKLILYLGKLNTVKPLITAGDFAILPPSNLMHTNITTREAKAFEKQKALYQEVLNQGLIDAYKYAPNGTDDATWWAPNVPKNIDKGIRIDEWLVSKKLQEKIKVAGPLDTGERRDHAPILLELE